MPSELIPVVVLTILTTLSIVIKEKNELLKYVLFGAIALVILSFTTYLIWSTISINTKSKTFGPVHWHADFEIWNCGEKLNLKDPQGWDNKIGTPLFHEHNDNRIHVEGPVMDYKDISLGEFFRVVGGELANGFLRVPINNGMVTVENGQECNGEIGEIGVFIYRTEGNSFYQEKLDDTASYVLPPYSQIPPGDCIIIEFDSPKDKTNKICNFYKIAEEKGELIEK